MSDRFEWIGRAGWIAKGIVYGLIGVLFLNIAWLGRSDGLEANQKGAVEAIAEGPFGSFLLILLAIGLTLYVIWRLFTVVLPGDWTGRALLDRLGYAVSAATYVTVLVAIIDVLLSTASASGDESEDRIIEALVKDTLSMTAGRWLVALAGAVVIGIGIVFVRKGWTKSFRDNISGDDGLEGTLVDRLGTIGWIARGAVMIVIGWFLGVAAYRYDPDEAAGFDDSIRQLANTGWGSLIAVGIAGGFIAFGAFSIVSARHRDLEGPRND
ncbi:MAG: DUF1206 domain-containing protein [Acidimicrobiales bacterium]|nr:DUF1206 domain-containing protein [Acidimicrobiales bacterium]